MPTAPNATLRCPYSQRKSLNTAQSVEGNCLTRSTNLVPLALVGSRVERESAIPAAQTPTRAQMSNIVHCGGCGASLTAIQGRVPNKCPLCRASLTVAYEEGKKCFACGSTIAKRNSVCPQCDRAQNVQRVSPENKRRPQKIK